MACGTCGHKRSCGQCDTRCGGCIAQAPYPVILPVERLPEIEFTNRYTMYLTPENELFIVNYNGDDFVQVMAQVVPTVEVGD